MPLGKKQKQEIEAFVNSQLEGGATVGQTVSRTRQKFKGAFDWATIIQLVLEIIKKWLDSRHNP